MSIPGGPAVDAPFAFQVPTLEDTARRMRFERERAAEQARLQEENRRIARERDAVRARLQDELGRAERKAACRRRFDAIRAEFKRNLFQAVEDSNAVFLDPKAKTISQPFLYPNKPISFFLVVLTRLPKRHKRGLVTRVPRFKPLYPECKHFSDAVSLDVGYEQAAKTAFKEGMFLLRPSKTFMLKGRHHVCYVLGRAWQDRDATATCLPRWGRILNYIDDAGLERDLRLHGLTDEQVHLAVYGSGHRARQEAKAAKEAADREAAAVLVVTKEAADREAAIAAVAAKEAADQAAAIRGLVAVKPQPAGASCCCCVM